MFFNLFFNKRIIEKRENNGNDIDDIAKKLLPTVKLPICIKGCNTINIMANKRTITEEYDHSKGLLKNPFLYLIN